MEEKGTKTNLTDLQMLLEVMKTMGMLMLVSVSPACVFLFFPLSFYFEFLPSLLTLLVAPVIEMKGRRRWWNASSFLCIFFCFNSCFLWFIPFSNSSLYSFLFFWSLSKYSVHPLFFFFFFSVFFYLYVMLEFWD